MEVFRSFCPSQTAPLGVPPGQGGTRQSGCGPTALAPSKTPRSAVSTVSLSIKRLNRDVSLSAREALDAAITRMDGDQ